jgi:hypothetical protein
MPEFSGPPRERAFRCRIAAEKALDAANAAKTPEVREGYLAVAKAWSKLADELDKMPN